MGEVQEFVRTVAERLPADAVMVDPLASLSTSVWREIGFWNDGPIIGEVGEMPWDYRPFATYVVLPTPPADEIQVTDEMIAAGSSAFWKYHPYTDPDDGIDALTLSAIFQAMMAAKADPPTADAA